MDDCRKGDVRLSGITGPDVQSDGASHAMSYRLTTGLQSAAAWLSPWHSRLPCERGPGLRCRPAQGGTEAREQGQVGVPSVRVHLSKSLQVFVKSLVVAVSPTGRFVC